MAETTSGRQWTPSNWSEASIPNADELPAAVAPILLEAPTAIPGYRIEQMLERRPGSWTVYQATEVASGESVALTILGAQLNHDRAYGKRLLRDLHRVAKLEHPSLVPVLTAGRAERGLFVVSELPDLITLEAALGLRVLQLEEIIRLFEPIAELLDRAHGQELVHRGLSPASILLTPDGRARVTGFGLADPVAAAHGSDEAMLFYMAPEQVSRGHVSARTDVYALAATTLICLTGVDPDSTSPSTSRRLLADRGSGVPPELDRVLDRALADRPGLRPASAGQLIEELRAAIGGRAVTAAIGGRAAASSEPATNDPLPALTRAANARVQPREAGRGSWRLAAVIGAAVLGAMAGTGFAALSSNRGDRTPQQAGRVTASTDRITLTGPQGWSRVKRPAAIPGLRLEQTVALASRRRGEVDGVLTAGFMRDVDPLLLRANMDNVLPKTPQREHVRVGRYEAYRYAGLRAPDSRGTLNLYVIPTTGGAATIACEADAGSESFLRDCEAVATTLVLKGVTVEPVGPSREYTAALRDTIGKLNEQRLDARRALSRAETAAAQARHASALARAFGTAATRQRSAPRRLSTASFNDRLTRRLREVRDAYGALAVAARRAGRPDYAARRRTVVVRERRVETLLASFKEL